MPNFKLAPSQIALRVLPVLLDLVMPTEVFFAVSLGRAFYVQPEIRTGANRKRRWSPFQILGDSLLVVFVAISYSPEWSSLFRRPLLWRTFF